MPSRFQTLIAGVTRDGDVTAVNTGLSDALAEIEDAARNLSSAEHALLTDDLSGSFALAYDAARKSIQAVLTANGFRVRSGEGSHKVFVVISNIDVFQGDGWPLLDWMRDVRNNAQYPRINYPKLKSMDCEKAINSAKLMHRDAKRILDSLG